GGLGVVEAGLTGTLALAGVSAAPAALATLAYRLASYWLALPVGLGAWIWHRRRYGPNAA
ncbi:MAG: lysylphosphatidylglycerol synthase transmembrane domain-containing protein, partial [Gaiellaceae bacterium]